jgi:hypothetical protein
MGRYDMAIRKAVLGGEKGKRRKEGDVKRALRGEESRIKIKKCVPHTGNIWSASYADTMCPIVWMAFCACVSCV